MIKNPIAEIHRIDGLQKRLAALEEMVSKGTVEKRICEIAAQLREEILELRKSVEMLRKTVRELSSDVEALKDKQSDSGSKKKPKDSAKADT